MAFYWKPYIPVAERRRKAAKEVEKRSRKGSPVSPVTIEGRTIAKTFWGKSWCENLERYSDYANRLPRGRTYMRNGSVVHLQIEPGLIQALVSGSELYEVTLKIAPVSRQRWKSICGDCTGAIDSLVSFCRGVFQRESWRESAGRTRGYSRRRRKSGLTAVARIGLTCVSMWRLFRLDRQPELLFRLREVDEKDLIVNAGKALPLAKRAPAADKVLDDEDLSGIFGLDMAQGTPAKRVAAKRVVKPVAKKKSTKKTVGKKKREHP